MYTFIQKTMTSKIKAVVLPSLFMALAGCATTGQVQSIAVDSNKPIQERVKQAIDTMCGGVFTDNAAIAQWYSTYGVDAVSNTRGYEKRVTEILRSARSSRTLFDLEDRDLFNSKYEAIKDTFDDYKEEILLPLSGQTPKKCGPELYCHEQSFEALTKRTNELEDSLPAIPASGTISSVKPISVLFNKAIGVAKGQCKQNMMNSMKPEYDEIVDLELPDVSGL
jgi:hypothetical protein